MNHGEIGHQGLGIRLSGVRMVRQLAVWSLLIAFGCGGEPPTIVDGDLAFVNVNVLPMDVQGARVLEQQTVVVEAGRISSIGYSDRFEPAADMEVVDANGHYLMPGLTEMHGHLPNPRMSDADIKNLLFLYIANGVTTVRGMQGDPSQFALRSAIDRGLFLGPNADGAKGLLVRQIASQTA